MTKSLAPLIARLQERIVPKLDYLRERAHKSVLGITGHHWQARAEIDRSYHQVLEEVAEVEREVTALLTEPAKDWHARYQHESQIVDEVWAALGISTVEQAQGKHIATLVSELRAEVLRLTAQLEQQKELAQLAYGLQREKHNDALASNPLFSVLHWKHHAGVDWPDVDDDSYQAFENCEYPDCKLVRAALVDQEPRPQLTETKDDSDLARIDTRGDSISSSPPHPPNGD